MNNKLSTEEKATAKPMLANRLLKFRGRKPNSKKWDYFNMNDYFLNAVGMFPRFLEHKMINICQFTGLLDKNGKEVYEGDIILDEEYDDDGCDISSNLEVLYDVETAQFVVDNSYAKTRTSLVSVVNYIGKDNLLVVGNIYENP